MRLCGLMARAFSNDGFACAVSLDDIVDMVGHRDRGWSDCYQHQGPAPNKCVTHEIARTASPDAIIAPRKLTEFSSERLPTLILHP